MKSQVSVLALEGGKVTRLLLTAVALATVLWLTFVAGGLNTHQAHAAGTYRAALNQDMYLHPAAPSEVLRVPNVPAGTYQINVTVLVGAAAGAETFVVRGGHDYDNTDGVLWGQDTTAGAGKLTTITITVAEVWSGGDFVVDVMPVYVGRDLTAKAKRLPNQGWGLYSGNATQVSLVEIP